MGDLIFGVNVSTAVVDGADPVDDARYAEQLGLDFVSASDHPGFTRPNLETWTMLAWIAAGTSRIHVASRVLGMPLRRPAMVAKMSETFDRLSGGRLILGLGAGGSDAELTSLGAPSATPGQRITGLEDALQIIRGMWAHADFTHDGPVYATAGAQLEPKPGRRIPIWLGTFGPRALRLTGRLADGWIPSLGHAAAEDLPAMRERVLASAREAGRDPGEIACVLNVEIALDGYAEPDPDVVSGSPEQIAERLAGFAAVGFGGFNLMPAGRDVREQLGRIADEVLPAVRAAAA